MSPGCRAVIRMMSIAGPMKKSCAGITRWPPLFSTTISASSATSAGAVSDTFTATQRLAPRIACSRFIAVGVSA